MDGQLSEGLRNDLDREIATVGRFALQSSTVGREPLAEALADLAWDALRRATDLARLIRMDGAGALEAPGGPSNMAAPSPVPAPVREGAGAPEILAADIEDARSGAAAYRTRLSRAWRAGEPFVAAVVASLATSVDEERSCLGRLLGTVQPPMLRPGPLLAPAQCLSPGRRCRRRGGGYPAAGVGRRPPWSPP